MTHGARLTISNLSLSFGGLRVLHDIVLTLRPGETLGLIGPNGAGKSALVNCICGIYSPMPGSKIEFEGASLIARPSHRIAALGITRTFQHIQLIESMSVMDNVMIGAASLFRDGVVGRYLRAYSSAQQESQIRRQALATLARCGIAEVAERPVAGLPLGIRRRIDLARALVRMPKVLLLDEPASGLSTGERALVRELIAIAQKDSDVAVIWIEHDLDLVVSVATRIVVLHHGRIVTEGSPRESDTERSRLIDAYLTGSVGRSTLGGHSIGSSS
jgi:branched-chain amino acid transport system ATP-binding protein